MAEKPDKDGAKTAKAEAQSPATPEPSPGSGLSRGKEADGGGRWQTHQFILGRRLG